MILFLIGFFTNLLVMLIVGRLANKKAERLFKELEKADRFSVKFGLYKEKFVYTTDDFEDALSMFRAKANDKDYKIVTLRHRGIIINNYENII